MLKKLLSMSLAVMMMSTACWGCNNEGGGASPDDTAADNGTHDSDAYVNKSGEAFPITMLSSSESDIKPVYDPRYTEANHRFVSSMLAALDGNENAVFSPLSLQIALQVLANGADDETAEKLLSAVCPGLTLDEVNESAESLIAMIGEDGGVNIENAVVYNDILQINKRFANTAADRYAASVGALDFSDPAAALAKINGWIEQNTDGLIKELIDELGPDTAVVIMNALTLKLDWAKPFTALRGLEEFNGSKGTEQTGFIQSSGKYSYGEFEEGRTAVVPYNGGKYAMAIMLPEKGYSPIEAASVLIPRIGECEETGVFVKMPKIELDSKYDIIAMSEKLGMAEALHGHYPALADREDVTVSQILHGASLSVTEYGTTAAAATAIVTRKSFEFFPEIKEFTCNRPYAMAIFNVETGAVLFVSAVFDV